MRNYFFTVLTWQNLLLFCAIFPVNKYPSNSEVICRGKNTYEGCDLVLPVTSSVGDSELIIHFQEAYARLFANWYNKHGIQSNLPTYRPMNQGTICAKVYPEGVQPTKGNNYAPNFGEVEGAYWFGSVRPSVRLSVSPSVRLSVTRWQLRNTRTAYARILQLYMWHVHEK